MKKDPKANPKSLKPLINKILKILIRHAVFTAIVVILLAYVFVVWKINQLSNADISTDTSSSTQSTSAIPKIDQAAVSQIQNLVQNSAQPLTPQPAPNRDNPFQE